MRRETDLIFAAAPSADQLAQAEALGVTLHLTPIGREAFVFFVNSRNPVTGLSVEEIQGIYSGKITNWSQVGGRNQSIRAYQRAENSGSQTALQALMADQPLMEPEQENRISAMDGIIRSVADYRNFSNAIGILLSAFMLRNRLPARQSGFWPWTASTPHRKPFGTARIPFPPTFMP